MLRVFLLLCLITQGNLAFTTKRTFRRFAETFPGVKQNRVRANREFGKILVNSAIFVNIFNVDKRSAVSNQTIIKIGNIKNKETIENNTKTIDHKISLKSGQNTVIRSIIPFTEGPLSAQFNDVNTASTIASKNGNLKSGKVLTHSPKKCNNKPVHRVHPKELDLILSSKKPNLNWPYFSVNPQIYEQFEDASEIEKAKDKRYSADFIPLHNNIPSRSSGANLLPWRYAHDADNPVFGDQAFFSFILNDYFDRNSEDDPTLFKDLHWGKEFDNEFATKGRDAKRIRRLENNYLSDYSFDTSTSVNLVTSGEQKQNNGSYLKVKKNKYSETCKGFKEFVEKFAQKFGSKNNENNAKSFVSNGEDQNNKESQTSTNTKDEFQETGELLDELLTNYNDDKVDEKESILTTISDFEHFLNAHETPSTNKDADDRMLIGNYATNHLRRFRYVAKNAALVNNADYIDTSEYAI